jgi:hypothetical protein
MRRWGLALVLLAGGAVQAQGLRVLDDFSQASTWSASASDQVRASARRDGRALCLDYDFGGVSGYAVLRRELAFELPANYSFELTLRGQGPANDFQFKLVDASGDNVWWLNRPRQRFEAGTQTLRVPKRRIEFAWGPGPDHTLRRFAAIEFAVVAARGGAGQGSVCFERIALRALPSSEPPPPPAVTWNAPAGRPTQTLDLRALREFNGIELQWQPGREAIDYDIEASDDRRHWRVLRRVRGGDGGVDALFLPDEQARWLRLRALRGAGARYALQSLHLKSDVEWPNLNAVLSSLAQRAPRSHFPRAFHGEQNYWTLIGVDGGGSRSALISEDGALELRPGGPSVEPFVQLGDGPLVGWSEVTISQHLQEGYLPLPSVRWRHPAFTLDIDAAAEGSGGASRLLARYTLSNPSDRPLNARLVLALRPWQVNPPQQFLTTPGGASEIRRVQWNGRTLSADGHDALQPLLRAPDAVSALPFDAGSPLARLEAGRALPPLQQIDDPNALASAVLVYRMTLAPHERRSVAWWMPLSGSLPADAPNGEAALQARFDAVAAQWRERLNRVAIRLPHEAQPLHDTLRSTLAQILLSRDGPALQPGTRSYQRSWIRDGAMMSAGLLRLGEAEAARDFVRWYAGHLFASGKVPCCIDARGADPVVENDSSGEFLFAVAELWRHTRDADLLRRLWPQVRSATLYLESLRQSERRGVRAAQDPLWGLMPASISHEGYSAKPMHSYWDDFWALRGYKDAVQIASALGHEDEARRWASWRDEFQRDLVDSMELARQRHRIDFIPGAAELGDFDATSTTVALNPAQAQEALPPDALHATFQRYWAEAEARREGRAPWQDYTPYELRTVGSFVRLQQPERAQALLQWFFAHRRPLGWNQWAEVVLRDERKPQFLGDMPHAWVASDFLRSALDLLAWEREADGTLVLAAGVPTAWAEEGVAVEGLSTRWGRLGYRLKREQGRVRLDIDGGAAPPGGFVLRWRSRDVHIDAAPATVWLD